MKELHVDGGCILKNPSTIGGTFAWCLVENDKQIAVGSGYVTPKSWNQDVITNNQMELYALIKGLEYLESSEVVKVCSDSEITLGRAFKDYALKNIPEWMKDELKVQQNRLYNFYRFWWSLIGGHPTESEILKGINKKGHVTSKWNVWCDRECNLQAENYLSRRVNNENKNN